MLKKLAQFNRLLEGTKRCAVCVPVDVDTNKNKFGILVALCFDERSKHLCYGIYFGGFVSVLI